jgi:hypothetical protein
MDQPLVLYQQPNLFGSFNYYSDRVSISGKLTLKAIYDVINKMTDSYENEIYIIFFKGKKIEINKSTDIDTDISML